MAVPSLDQAARLTELGKITITRAINCSWLSARLKKDGIYEVDPVEHPSPRRLHALMPWRAARLADLRADEELRRRAALAEERLADLKAALEDMRAQRDAWQERRRRAYDRRPRRRRRGGLGCAQRGDLEPLWRGTPPSDCDIFATHGEQVWRGAERNRHSLHYAVVALSGNMSRCAVRPRYRSIK